MSRPKAIATGTLFDGLLDCYVLDNGQRFISQRGGLRALRGKTDGPGNADLGRYIARLPKRFADLTVVPGVEFELPDGGVALGREVNWFSSVLDAYVASFMSGELKTSQHDIARRAHKLQSAVNKIGWTALIDEATGYQYHRHERALDRAIKVLLRDQAGEWQLMWDQRVVEAFCGLYGHKFAGGSIPPWLRSPMRKAYDFVMGSEVMVKLKDRNPDPGSATANHHSFFTPEGDRLFREELRIMVAIILDSRGPEHFWQRFARHCGLKSTVRPTLPPTTDPSQPTLERFWSKGDH